MLKFTCCSAAQTFVDSAQLQVLSNITRGYERECLRVDAQGQLAQTPHPRALGSKLKHPWITTDYSESLLEFITPPSRDIDYPLSFLKQVHQFSAQQLHGEVMWAGSMPCPLGKNEDIPIADYGSSNSARMKRVYRDGLSLRYGRHMQAIAGAHYNWSLPEAFWPLLKNSCGATTSDQDFISERYFGLIRNFLRYSWLIPYLFGASPALDTSFLQGRKTELQELFPGTLYAPYATSLRMSDLGYQNRAQANLHVSFNSLAEYTQALEAAIRTPDPLYEALGVRDGSGPDAPWKQLNANLLQIENEFYAGIRPKRIGKLGERPAKALRTYGVEYVEVRLFDLNPFIDIGIAPEQSTFADIFLLMCLFRQSPPISAREQADIDENKRRVVTQGRKPDLQLLVQNSEQAFQTVAHDLFDDMTPFAAMLDKAYGPALNQRFSETLTSLRQRIDAPDTTPSAKVLAAVREHGGFAPCMQALARHHHDQLVAQRLDDATQARFEASVAESLARQAELEARDQGSLEEYVARYYA